jgi:gamma-glutamyl-gamma-aminobutyrate hydrolase PuuD
MNEAEPGSTLGPVEGQPMRRIETIHHQAVAGPGSLTATTTGPGGVIEGVEARRAQGV